MVAGQTYVFSERGTGSTPLNDSFLVLFNPGGTLATFDDDGGNGIFSLITYTATQTGTYFLRAQSFDNGDSGTGTYTLDVRQQGVDFVGSTNDTAVTIGLGNTFGFIESSGDLDRYAVHLDAGHYYTFQLAGGADYATDYQNVPTGELDTRIALRSADGTLLVQNDDANFPNDISSAMGFYAQTSGTYYIDAQAYPGQTGGYALNVSDVDFANANPLDLDQLGERFERSVPRRQRRPNSLCLLCSCGPELRRNRGRRRFPHDDLRVDRLAAGRSNGCSYSV